VAAAPKTLLLINELGAGYGHVAPLLRVGTALAGRGLRIVYAMADVVRPGLLLRRAGFAVLQAPKWPGVRAEKGSSYGDLLALLGFESVPALMLMTEAWQDLFDLVRPDAIVANHSPTAALTAHGSIPLILVGNGFELPPADLPEFPSLRPGAAPLVPEAKLLETVLAVQRHRGRPAPQSLPSLFAAEFRAVCALAELDPYADQRHEPLLGPVEPLPAYRPRPADRPVFAYLGIEHPDIYEIAAGLCAANAKVTCHVRGDPGTIGASLVKSAVTVLDGPADLTEVLPASSAVVGYASAGIAQAALAAGRPQLALPYDLEKETTASALDRLGVSRTLGPGLTADQVAQAIDALLSDDQYAHYAAVCAQTIMARPPTDALGAIVEACLTLLG
jgi:UDP:flavonoid glycosyltransferase YjiC (YdhE family)